MTIDIKKLTVSTDDQRKGWIELLDKASQYHFDIIGSSLVASGLYLHSFFRPMYNSLGQD